VKQRTGTAACLSMLAAGLMLAGCSTPAPRQQAREDAVRLEASVSQSRFDEGTRRLRAAVTNDGAATVQVTSATVDWSGFEPDEALFEDGRLGPGQTAGIALRYGEPRCAGDPTDRVALGVTVDGVEHRVLLQPDDAAALRRLHVRACSEQRLERGFDVTLELGRRPVVLAGEEYLPGAVVVRRHQGSTEPLTVLDLRGSVLLELTARDGRSALPRRLPAADDVLRLPTLIGSAHRCDGHALGQSSQTFLLSIFVRIGTAPDQRVIVIPGKADRARLTAILDRDCGVGPTG
jgi:uncharacterized protein YceK